MDGEPQSVRRGVGYFLAFFLLRGTAGKLEQAAAWILPTLL